MTRGWAEAYLGALHDELCRAFDDEVELALAIRDPLPLLVVVALDGHGCPCQLVYRTESLPMRDLHQQRGVRVAEDEDSRMEVLSLCTETGA